MQYSLEKITTVAGRDTLLTMAQKKKQKLERRRRNLGESIGDFRKRMDYLEKESVRVQTSLDALKTAHQAMPEGKEKVTIHIMIKRLELRQAQLEKRAYTCNVASLLVKELRYNHLDSQVAAMEEYIAAVQEHRFMLAEVVMSICRPDATLHLEQRMLTPGLSAVPEDLPWCSDVRLKSTVDSPRSTAIYQGVEYLSVLGQL